MTLTFDFDLDFDFDLYFIGTSFLSGFLLRGESPRKKKSMDSYSKISLETHILNSYNPIYPIKYLVKKNFWPKKNIGQKIFGQKNIW